MLPEPTFSLKRPQWYDRPLMLKALRLSYECPLVYGIVPRFSGSMLEYHKWAVKHQHSEAAGT